MSKLDNFTNEEFKEMVLSSQSMSELSKKLGYAQGGYNGKAILAKCEELDISLDHFTHKPKQIIQRNENNIFIENSTASQTVLRRWYKKNNYTPYQCSICGLEPFWNGKELTLTLDHINGINNDDRLENLRWICPNCDRQLDTFSGKNIKKEKKDTHFYCVECGIEISYGATLCNTCRGVKQRKVDRPNKEELIKILYENKGNFTLVGKLYSVTDNAIRKWCKNYNISPYSKDYK